MLFKYAKIGSWGRYTAGRGEGTQNCANKQFCLNSSRALKLGEYNEQIRIMCIINSKFSFDIIKVNLSSVTYYFI